MEFSSKDRVAEEGIITVEEASCKERYDTRVQSCSLVHASIATSHTPDYFLKHRVGSEDGVPGEVIITGEEASCKERYDTRVQSCSLVHP